MSSSTDWARSIATTIVNHLREEEIASLRKYKVFAALEASGNVRMNMAGRGFDWEVRYRNHTPSGNNGETPRSFARTNLWKRAELDYRGAQASDAIYKKEMLENRSAQALCNVAGKMASRLLESMEQYLSKEWVLDGNASGNELRMHGVESFLGTSGTITAATGATPGTSAAGDMFGAPSDTYAGLSTALGAYGGSAPTAAPTWPNGSADPEYDFYSPVIVNYTSTAFGATTTWAANCVKAIREALHQTRRNDTKEDQIDMILLDRRLYIDFLNSLDSKERIIVAPGRPNGLKSFGFTDVVELDGVEISAEGSVPANTGYGLSIGNMEMLCMEGQLLNSEGPFYDEITQQFRYVVSVLGNLKFKSPRNFFKLSALA